VRSKVGAICGTVGVTVTVSVGEGIGVHVHAVVVKNGSIVAVEVSPAVALEEGAGVMVFEGWALAV